MNGSTPLIVRLSALFLAVLWIMLLWLGVPRDSTAIFSWHAFLIDSENPMWPLTMQALMWLSFFYCVADLLLRWLYVLREERCVNGFDVRYPRALRLSSGEEIQLAEGEMLKPEILAALCRAKRAAGAGSADSMISSMFFVINNQFQSTRSVGDVYNAVTARIDLELHNVDLGYTVVKYLAWLIPTLGFIGTVIGLVQALGVAGQNSQSQDLIRLIVPSLGTAFYTTLLALLLTAFVVVGMQFIQAHEERVVNSVGRYCIDNIVSELYISET